MTSGVPYVSGGEPSGSMKFHDDVINSTNSRVQKGNAFYLLGRKAPKKSFYVKYVDCSPVLDTDGIMRYVQLWSVPTIVSSIILCVM